MLWTITISCVHGAYLEEKVSKICEVNPNIRLEDLCDFILESFKFDNDHLHRFFISRSIRNDDNEVDEEKCLKDIYPLEKNNYLYMLFDYGDDWVFKIAHSNKKAVFDKKKKYPRVIKHIGKNPEQYPMYDG